MTNIHINTIIVRGKSIKDRNSDGIYWLSCCVRVIVRSFVGIVFTVLEIGSIAWPDDKK